MAGKTPTRYIPYTITTAAFTAIAAPLSTALNAGNVILVSVHLMVPPGHVGLTGIRLDDSGGTILPFANPPQWITGDNRDIVFDLDVQADAQMTWKTYNLDVNAHAHYLLLKVVDIADRPSSTTAPSLIGLSG